MDNPNVKKLVLSDPEPLPRVYHTSDGYRFWRQPDGSWGDGDLAWPTEEEMRASLGEEGEDWHVVNEPVPD
jgi:hypothetical protein